MAERDPTRALLTAARKLAACTHATTIVLDDRRNRPIGPGAFELCLQCGAHRLPDDAFTKREWKAPALVDKVADAARGKGKGTDDAGE